MSCQFMSERHIGNVDDVKRRTQRRRTRAASLMCTHMYWMKSGDYACCGVRDIYRDDDVPVESDDIANLQHEWEPLRRPEYPDVNGFSSCHVTVHHRHGHVVVCSRRFFRRLARHHNAVDLHILHIRQLCGRQQLITRDASRLFHQIIEKVDHAKRARHVVVNWTWQSITSNKKPRTHTHTHTHTCIYIHNSHSQPSFSLSFSHTHTRPFHTHIHNPTTYRLHRIPLTTRRAWHSPHVKHAVFPPPSSMYSSVAASCMSLSAPPPHTLLLLHYDMIYISVSLSCSTSRHSV